MVTLRSFLDAISVSLGLRPEGLSETSLAVGFALLNGPQSPREVRQRLKASGQADGLGGILIIEEHLDQLRKNGLAVPVRGARRNLWALSENGRAGFSWAHSTTEHLRDNTGSFRLRESNEIAKRITPQLERIAVRGVLSMGRKSGTVSEALRRWIN